MIFAFYTYHFYQVSRPATVSLILIPVIWADGLYNGKPLPEYVYSY